MNRNNRAKDSKTAKGIGVVIDHNQQTYISKSQFIAGDTSNKIPIYLSDGKTTVFAKYQKDVEKLKKFWEDKIKRKTS